MNKPIIGVIELAAKLASGEKILIADCRFDPSSPDAGRMAYDRGHIPGAHYLHLDEDLAAPMGTTGGRHPLPAVEDFTELMCSLGVDMDTLIVAYDGGGLAAAARLWWLARYFGHAKVVVLDGGLAAWVAAEQSLDEEPAVVARGNFSARIDDSLRVDFDTLLHNEGSPLLIDTRDALRYAGAEEAVDPIPGHIPGAINVPFMDSIGENGLLLDAKTLREYWAWLEDSVQPPVVYCGSGVTACVTALALEVAGVDDVRLYPGSWSDWCQRGGAIATGQGTSDVNPIASAT